MTTSLHDYPLPFIFLVTIVILLAASEAGRFVGMRASGRGGDDVTTLEGAALGLLALMIGFTLSRFEARRDAVLAEASAIGTTALRARLLPSPHNIEINKLLREYVKLRLDLTQRVASTTDNGARCHAAASTRSGALCQLLPVRRGKDSPDDGYYYKRIRLRAPMTRRRSRR